MQLKLRWVVIAIVLFSQLFAWQTSSAQPTNQLYFPETGHIVVGDFLVTYQSAPDPLLVYGYPITDAFQDQLTGQLIQYFQRARFELHPEAPPELRVQRTPLGWLLYVPGPAIPVQRHSPACRFYIETDFQVCYDFLSFFDANGGVAQFGYPISGFEIQGGRVAQYFQKARLEWHPEFPSGKRVVLADLGMEYFKVRGEDPSLLKADSNMPIVVLSIQARVFVQHPILPLQGAQTISVLVQNQNSWPVQNARVSLQITYPDQQVQSYEINTLTDSHGIVRFTFTSTSSTIGLVIIRVTIRYNDFEQHTVTSYRVWW